MEKEKTRVRVIKSHKVIEEVFPLGFETTYRKTYTEEHKVVKGFWTRIYGEVHYVEPVNISKGTFKDIVFIGKNGSEYSSDWLYKCTGKSAGDFFEKI